MATNKPTRILLADDHTLVRRGFAMIVSKEEDMEVVGEASNGREAVELAGQLLPDVVVIDVTMPELNGIEGTRRIMEICPRTRGLALNNRAIMRRGLMFICPVVIHTTRITVVIGVNCIY